MGYTREEIESYGWSMTGFLDLKDRNLFVTEYEIEGKYMRVSSDKEAGKQMFMFFKKLNRYPDFFSDYHEIEVVHEPFDVDLFKSEIAKLSWEDE